MTDNAGQDDDRGDVPRDRRLFREAADLAIRLQNDPGNMVAVETIRAWAARSPEHRAAWARVAAIHGMTGKVLGAERRTAGPSRRNVILGGLIGIGAGAWFGPELILRARADYLTSTAELREIGLPDGSSIALGPDSALALDWTEQQRRVVLLQGMGFFTVAPDMSRPFSVEAGGITATALGTAFEVSHDAGYVSVSVDHGLVEARGIDPPEHLAAGDWLTFAPDATVASKGQREPGEMAAWRRGLLIAEGETVAALVARIARWQPGSVVIADPGLGRKVVSGVFDLREPIGALEAVVRPFGAQVRQISPLLTVISPL